MITLEDSSSFGDAFREINQLQALKNDFLLVGGDFVSNINLSKALQEHYQRKKEDKNRKLILTKLFVKMPFSSAIRSQS